MSNVAVDRYGRRWHGYEYMSETVWHPEGADTDMADITNDELQQMLGPISYLATTEKDDL